MNDARTLSRRLFYFNLRRVSVGGMSEPRGLEASDDWGRPVQDLNLEIVEPGIGAPGCDQGLRPPKARRSFNLGRVDLVSIQLAVLCAEHGSLSRGAKQADMSLTRASHRLKELEILLGQQLFVRSPQGLTSTAAGATLVDHGRELMRNVETLVDAIGKTDFFEELPGACVGQAYLSDIRNHTPGICRVPDPGSRKWWIVAAPG